MTRLEWDDFLVLDDADEDREHKELFEILGRLGDPERRGRREVLSECVDALAIAAEAHMIREEALMEACEYPLRHSHRQRHEELRARLAYWRNKIGESWQPWLGGTVYIWLADRLTHHVVNDDYEMIAFARTGRFARSKLAA